MPCSQSLHGEFYWGKRRKWGKGEGRERKGVQRKGGRERKRKKEREREIDAKREKEEKEEVEVGGVLPFQGRGYEAFCKSPRGRAGLPGC